jgi:putative FmdB family regulatory protein
MPTYEYRCRQCGHHLEVVQSFTDDPLTTCPVCEGELRKVFSPIGVSFKGSGFYRTDSRSSRDGGRKKSRAESSSDSSSSSSSGSESSGSSSSGSSDGGGTKSEAKTA